jgi:hypothetical protein
MTHASAITEGGSSAASMATRIVASVLAENVPVLLVLIENDNAVGEFEEQLVECAWLAERQVPADPILRAGAPARALPL